MTMCLSSHPIVPGITRSNLSPCLFRNANWMVVGALAALLLGFCTSAIGSCGRYRHRNAEKV